MHTTNRAVLVLSSASILIGVGVCAVLQYNAMGPAGVVSFVSVIVGVVCVTSVGITLVRKEPEPLTTEAVVRLLLSFQQQAAQERSDFLRLLHEKLGRMDRELGYAAIHELSETARELGRQEYVVADLSRHISHHGAVQARQQLQPVSRFPSASNPPISASFEVEVKTESTAPMSLEEIEKEVRLLDAGQEEGTESTVIRQLEDTREQRPTHKNK